jgi:hypothetical protein
MVYMSSCLLFDGDVEDEKDVRDSQGFGRIS